MARAPLALIGLSKLSNRPAMRLSSLATNATLDQSKPSLSVSHQPTRDWPSADPFKLLDMFTIEDLLNARCHFGHKERLLNEHMRPFIFGKRLGVLIFDLDQTAKMLRKALQVTAEIAYRKGIILFVHGSRQNGWIVEKAAQECKEYAYCRRWNNEVFTNSERLFSAVVRLPDLVIMFSTIDQANTQHKAVVMSAKMLIPTIGICDTNSNPTLITYPVPGNDDTPESIQLYSRLFRDAVLRGKAKREEVIEEHGEEFYHETLISTNKDE